MPKSSAVPDCSCGAHGQSANRWGEEREEYRHFDALAKVHLEAPFRLGLQLVHDGGDLFLDGHVVAAGEARQGHGGEVGRQGGIMAREGLRLQCALRRGASRALGEGALAVVGESRARGHSMLGGRFGFSVRPRRNGGSERSRTFGATRQRRRHPRSANNSLCLYPFHAHISAELISSRLTVLDYSRTARIVACLVVSHQLARPDPSAETTRHVVQRHLPGPRGRHLPSHRRCACPPTTTLSTLPSPLCPSHPLNPALTPPQSGSSGASARSTPSSTSASAASASSPG